MIHIRRLTTFLLLISLFITTGCDILDSDDDKEPVLLKSSVYAEGLLAPIGIEVDEEGRLWVGEQGTDQDDSRISIITTDGQVHPFMAGLPSELVEGDPLGALRPYIGDSGPLQFIQGEGTDALSASLHSVDLSGFNPGDAPLDTSAVQTEIDINDFMLGEKKFNKSNPYAMAIGPNGNQFFADAGANAIIRRDTDTSQLSVFAEFQDISNPTSVGPPMMDTVPTDIIFKDGRFWLVPSADSRFRTARRAFMKWICKAMYQC